MKLEAYGATDVGRVRQGNEDNFILYSFDELKEGTDFKIEGLKNGFAAFVADGMGGAVGGEVASQTSVFRAVKYFKENNGVSDPQKLIGGALDHANEGCRLIVEKNPEMKGMGAVATLCIIMGNSAHFGQIGDSRGYLYRAGTIKQLTEDQTMVNQLLKIGALTEEQAKNHPQKNAVAQAIGPTKDLKIEYSNTDLQSGDILLLCSDGLSGMVTDADMVKILKDNKPLSDTAKKLIDKANANGGKDNITVILVKVG